MAAFDLQEQEQIEAIRSFWHSWGRWLALALTFVCLGYLGFQGWQMYQRKQAAAAGEYYAQIESHLERGQQDKLAPLFQSLKQEYASTAYANRAALIEARLAFEAGQFAPARASLEWVIEHTKEEAIRDLARWRLAAVLLDEKQFDRALAELTKPHTDGFAGSFLDLKGDVLVAKGDIAAARSAYRAALQKLEKSASPSRSLTEIKLDALGAE